MAFNGAGTFQLVAGNPVVTGTVISSTWANNTLNDIANNGLTNCITKDGQTTPTGNIPLGGFRITSVADAVNAQDVVNARQVQNGGLVTLSTVSGSDTITAVASPTPSAYVAGQRFQFVAAGSNTATAPTLNVNGLGAKTITKNGALALVPGDIPAGGMVAVTYDGTQFQLQTSTGKGLFLGVQVFSASGTYTPTPGARTAIVKAVGGGGAGGGAQATGAGQNSVGGGGAAGAYGEIIISSGLTTTTVTIGAGGTGVSGANGGAGGSTSFGSLLVATGGNGGNVGPPVTSAALSAFGGTRVNCTGTGTFIVNAFGQSGATAYVIAIGTVISGMGGVSAWGSGGVPQSGNASGFGSGGSGTSIGVSSAAQAGAAGAPGLLMVMEYA